MKNNRFGNRENKDNTKEFTGPKNGSKGILYYLVAIYIGYMGYSIMHNRLAGDATLSYPLAILFTSVFAVGAVWIVWYATKLRKNQAAENERKETNQEEIVEKIVEKDEERF